MFSSIELTSNSVRVCLESDNRHQSLIMETLSRERAISLRGIFPPIPTAFTTSGDIDHLNLQNNLAKWSKEPLDGYVLLGSNGEYPFLSPDEQVETVRTAREVIPSGRLLISGAGMEGTRETIGLCLRMAEAGADAALINTPHYYKTKMTTAAIEHHYNQIAEACPIPIIMYNVPVYTGLDIHVESVIKLSEHPNIIGIKESSSNIGKFGIMVKEVSKDFQVLTGSASGFLGTLSMGAVGGVMALANIAATQLNRLMEHFEQGNLAKAGSIQRELIRANVAITAHYGIPGLKAALDMQGYYGGPVRSPLMPLSDSERDDLRVILTKAGLL